MRKLLLALVLPLVLLLAQQGRATHELGHLLSQRAGSPRGQQDQQPADKLCASCLAFAQVTAGAAATAPAVALLSATQHHGPAPRAARLAVPAPKPRSRGPPTFH